VNCTIAYLYKDEMFCIQNEVAKLIANTRMSKECCFKFGDVKCAVSCLKAHRNDGSTRLNSNHLINADGDCLTLLARLLVILAFSVPYFYFYFSHW